MSGLRQDQVDTLLRPIRPRRVLKDRDGMSHVAAYDVIAHMNRVFGFGNWDTDVVRLGVFFKDPSRPRYEDTRWRPAHSASEKLALLDKELDAYAV